MNARTIKILAVAVVVLFAAVFLIDRQRSGGGSEANELLFPELEEQLNAVTGVTVTDADGAVTITREGGRWIVPGKGGYPADTGALRDLLVAIAEARKVEQKTSNSEYYDRLGLLPPAEEEGGGTLVEIAGTGTAAVSLILGDAAQREYRYARIPGEAQSWLIDRNPDLPGDAAGWLVADIVDIPSSRIQSVTITHEDGETIHLSKATTDAANFELEGIPEGRELSYPSVGNGIASVPGALTLEDVRSADAGEASMEAATATTVYTTFDGLQLTIDSTTANEETWISLEAAAVPQAEGEQAARPDETLPGASAESPASADEAAGGSTEQEAAEPAAAEPEAGAPEEADTPVPADQAETINARVTGWEYRIPQYKANQLTRRWEDLLADPESASADE